MGVRVLVAHTQLLRPPHQRSGRQPPRRRWSLGHLVLVHFVSDVNVILHLERLEGPGHGYIHARMILKIF